MTEYYVILEGWDKFQLEQTRAFEGNIPPPTFKIRNYEPLECPGKYFNSETIQVKDRCFRLQSHFYALGKNLAYYKQVS